MSQPADPPSRRSVLAAGGAALAVPPLARGQGTSASGAAHPPGVPAGAGVQKLEPKGYALRFQPVREMISQGRYPDALLRFPASGGAPAPAADAAKAPAKTAKDDKAVTAPATDANAAAPQAIVHAPFLLNVERGLIAFEAGQPEEAVRCFHAAEESLSVEEGAAPSHAEEPRRGAKVMKFIKKAGAGVAGKVSGQEELSPYQPLDHERVLELNYLTLAYVLQGQSQCYNVTRRCIEQQGLLKAKFDKEIAEYKDKYQKASAQTSKSAPAGQSPVQDLTSTLDKHAEEASRVPNAYVNPLGDYLAGLIQEIVSHDQPSLRDNARIAYDTAAKLCGRSPQLSAAAAAMARARAPAHERVVHVLVSEGFAPARNVLTFGLALQGKLVVVRIPVFEPVPSAVDHVVVKSDRGATLAALDPIGDFEAIRLRDQHDRIPEIMVGVLAGAMGSYLTSEVTSKMGVIGLVLQAGREVTATADTRSWLSLPRRFHVARVPVTPATRAVVLASYGKSGRLLASQAVPLLADQSQSVIYARATDDGVHVQAARRLWIDGKIEGEHA